MSTRDPYQVLGLSSGASAEEVTAAYVELATSTRDPVELAAIEQAYAAVTATSRKPSPSRANASSGRQPNRREGEGKRKPRESRTAEGKGNAQGQSARRPVQTPKPDSSQEKAPAAPAPVRSTEDFDPYRALNLTPKASPEQIKASYERLMAMTRRQARRAQIEQAYQMLTGEKPGAAAAAAPPRSGETRRRTRAQGPQQPGAPREIPRPVATRETPRAVSMADAMRQAAARRESAARQEVPPEPSAPRAREERNLRYWYIAFAVLVVIAVLAVMFLTVWR